MANVAFDTLTASKDLQSAGIDVRHAEAIALVVKDSQGDLATKADIDQLRTELRTEIDHLRSEVKADSIWHKWSIALVVAIMLGGFTAVISLLP